MQSIINFIGLAGCCSKTTVAPLDRVKILLQAHNAHYRHLGIVMLLKQKFTYVKSLNWVKGS